MATVTGYTATRMKQIEDETVVGATLIGYNLVLVRRDGIQIDVGNIRGEPGPTGPAAEMATSAETIAGVITNKAVTPAGLEAKKATPSVYGLTRYANNTEALAGRDDLAASPAGVQTILEAGYSVKNYTPAVTNWTLGAGSAVGHYVDFGGLVYVFVKVIFGSGAVFTADNPRIALPPGVVSLITGADSRPMLNSTTRDITNALRLGRGECQTTTTISPLFYMSAPPGDDYQSERATKDTEPFVWAVGDYIVISGFVLRAP